MAITNLDLIDPRSRVEQRYYMLYCSERDRFIGHEDYVHWEWAQYYGNYCLSGSELHNIFARIALADDMYGNDPEFSYLIMVPFLNGTPDFINSKPFSYAGEL